MVYKYKDKKKLIRIIASYLHDKKALELFCHNYVTYHNVEIPNGMKPKERTIFIIDKGLDDLLKYFKSISAVRDIHVAVYEFFASCVSAFPWGDAPEGPLFWASISEEWLLNSSKNEKEIIFV